MKAILRLALALLGIVTMSGGMSIAADDQPRTISVVGEAEVKVVPDEVVIKLGVHLKDSNLTAVVNEVDSRVEAILQTARSFALPAKDIQTDYIHVETRYEYYGTFIGYFVTKKVSITLKNLPLFDSLITSLIQAGANYVYEISFRTSELRLHRDQARLMAVRAARDKANSLAVELNQVIDRPKSIKEVSLQTLSWYDFWMNRHVGEASQNVMQIPGSAESSYESDAISPGQISIRAKIAAEFELQ